MTRLFTIHDVDEETLVQYVGLHPMEWRVEYGKPAAMFAEVDDPVYDAAPELLAATKLIREFLPTVHPGCVCDSCNAVRYLDDVIAKAEGVEP